MISTSYNGICVYKCACSHTHTFVVKCCHMCRLTETDSRFLIINSAAITLTLLLPLRSTRMFPSSIMNIYSYIPALRNATINVSVSNEAISLCFFQLALLLRTVVLVWLTISLKSFGVGICTLHISIMSLNFTSALFNSLPIHLAFFPL